MTEKKPRSRNKKVKEAAVPKDVQELLDQPIEDEINEIHAQGIFLEKVANLTGLIEVEGKLLEGILMRSGFNSLASHVKALRERSAHLAKELNKVKPHGRLKFEKGDFSVSK